jgi:hypothetical protein
MVVAAALAIPEGAWPLSGPRPEAPSHATGPTPGDYEAAIAGKDPSALERLLAKLPSFTDPDGHEFYIFQGDLPYTREQVKGAIEDVRVRRARKAVRQRLSPELKLEAAPAGQRLYWRPDERALTYAIDKASFAAAPAGVYDMTVTSLAAAASQWEALCSSCGLTIRHRPELDRAIDRSKVTFVVTYSTANTGEVALAFFPATPEDQRTLFVYSLYATTRYDRAGVFRHELGHILGYAHEQLAETGMDACAQTPDGWTRLTTYDPKSVMHYKCGNRGNYQLTFTDCDQAGHRHAYASQTGNTAPKPLPPGSCKGTLV